MNKITAFVFMLIAQYILTQHDLHLFNWEWWVLMICLCLYDFFWED